MLSKTRQNLVRYSTVVIVLLYLSIATLRNFGFVTIIETEPALVILFTIAILCLFVVIQKRLHIAQYVCAAVLLVLFIYNAAISIFPGVSTIFSAYFVLSGLLFIALFRADESFFEDIKLNHISNEIRHPSSVSDVAKLSLIGFAVAHALSMILIYIAAPERTTGLLDDFTQASTLLLIAYGMAYPILKDKKFFLPFTLIIFIAYFTSFSRTANFLLALFMMALFIIEYKNNHTKRFFIIAATLIVALILVYAYPNLIGGQAVDRGGLATFSTLNSRTIYWQVAWDAIKTNPLWGHGLGSYTYTGIKQAQPFNTIHFVHNDYLQIWHDLGVFWLLLFISCYAYILARHLPFKIRIGSSSNSIAFKDSSNYRSIFDWLLLVLLGLYMSINFLILNLEFQTALAILIASIIKK